MNNPELEELIDAALADGVLTEKEKQILFKKAQTLGVDLDEFEMILDARLVKMKKAEQENAAKSAPKSDKLGDVRKCPACGAMIGSFLMSCPECGFEFSGIGPNKYVSELSAKLDAIADQAEAETASSSNQSTIFDIVDVGGMMSNQLKDERKDELIVKKEVRLIKNYPLPMTKEDSLEMLYFILPKTKYMGSNGATHAWRSKFFEVLNRTERYAAKDTQLKETLNQFREDAKINGFAKFAIWLKSKK